MKMYKMRLDIVKSKEREHTVYDGPGTMFEMLKVSGKKDSYITSTFQCLLQFMLTYLIQSYSQKFNFYLVQHSNKVHKKLQPDTEMNLKMPLNNCLQNLCVLLLEGTTGFNLNFMVINVTVHSHDMATSFFYGITLGEIWNDDYLTMADICPDIDMPENLLNRSFYIFNK